MNIWILMLLFVALSACDNEDNMIDDGRVKLGKVHDLGLQVNSEGVLLYQGEAYKGIGVNYFNAFSRNIKDSSDETYKDGFQLLMENNIPFIRFMACGFWPIDWKLYLNDKEEYFYRLDRLVESAEKEGIGLIPSLFWHTSTIPDIVNESVNQWGNADSKTIDFMKIYTTEVVSRYLLSPAIWGWEFSNEFNLKVDLPGLDHLPQIAISRGTPATRSEEDKLSTVDMMTAMKVFGETVRELDASRIIFSGNSMPRPAAYNLEVNGNWTQDSRAEHEISLTRQNPDPINSLTVHFYGETDRFKGSLPTISINDVIKISKDHSIEEKKPLFLGEFGPSLALEEQERTLFMEILQSITVNDVPLSCVWVFDYPPQDTSYNITFNNSRKYMLEEIGKINY